MADEQNTTSVDDGMGHTIEVPTEETTDPFQEWVSQQPEDLQQRIQSAGVKDFDHLARTWNSAEDARQRMQSERDRAMAMQMQAIDTEDEYEEEPLPQVGSQMIPQMDELLPIFGNSETAVMDYIAQTRAQELEARVLAAVEAKLNETIAPIQTQATQAQLNDAIGQIQAMYPDEWRDMGEEVVQLIAQYPQQYDSPQGIFSAFGLVKAARDHETAMQRAAQANADTIQGNPGPRQGANAADAVLRAMDDVRPRRNDGLG